MTQEHLITPPPELVRQWDAECESGNNAEINSTFDALQQFACKAARWGADQELEACCEWLKQTCGPWELPAPLRAARRPKPPSLKEQALSALHAITSGADDTREFYQDIETIKTALEALPDD